MGAISLRNVVKRYGVGAEGQSGHPWRERRDRRRRIRRHRRALGLRQVDAAAHGRRARGDHRRRDRDRRPRRQRRRAVGARHRDGVPELRALPAHERVRQHGLRAEDREGADRRDQAPRRQGGEDPRDRPLPRAQAARALGRPAPARRDGPRDRAPAGGVPVRRAALEPRRQAARADAARDPEAAPRARTSRRSSSRTTRSRR